MNAPLLMVAGFSFSLAVLKVQNGILLYRRFFRWYSISREDVVASGRVGPVGYIKLKQFLPPWGRLYFVLDKDLEVNPFRNRRYGLLQWLSEGTVPSTEEIEKAERGPFPQITPPAAGAIGTAFGALAQAIGSILGPPSYHSVFDDQDTQPRFIPWSYLKDLRVGMAVLAILVLAAAYRRNRSQARLFAFLAGVFTTSVLYHLLHLT